MTRVVVIGAPGSGKTTLARTLARELLTRHVELDAILHGPDGREPSCAEFRAAVLPELERESWVVDGWHEQRLGTLALERADTIVFLDPPLPMILARLLRRSVGEIVLRKELWNGNRQTWRGAFGGRRSLVGYALRRHRELRRRVSAVRQQGRFGSVEWVHLRGANQAKAWLERRSPQRSALG